MNRIIRKRRAVIALALGFTAVPATALAVTDAVPGDPFKLGTSQKIDKASTILTGTDQLNDGVLQVRKEGTGIGSALKVVNAGAGIGRRGIDITVPANQPPLAINADAGKATNLNADELDGRDEEDFLPSRLYSGTAIAEGQQGGGKPVVVAPLRCDEGDVAISGGGISTDIEDDLNGIVPFNGSYQVQFQDNGSPSRFTGRIICADAARPFR